VLKAEVATICPNSCSVQSMRVSKPKNSCDGSEEERVSATPCSNQSGVTDS